jgi:DNA-binding CsgD family transcriptional regulator
MWRRGPQLSPVERTVLAASATGRTSSEVAELLGLPPAEVRQRIASAAQKLGARSKLETVLIALQTGQIDLRDADAAEHESDLGS